VRFWDTSALIPLLLREPYSEEVRRLLTEDSAIVAWWATRVECTSAITRRTREGYISAGDATTVRGLLKDLSASWVEVRPSSRVRELAEQSLTIYPLRAADALQLASALVWCEDHTEGREFVSFDRRLRSAASSSGFAVLPGTAFDV
jgi:predicted nucleic acid-binding protein